MKYNNPVFIGTFLSRPNRFIAQVKLGKDIITVHVKNTGRCKELLTEGARVYLLYYPSKTRKTLYDLIAVEKHINGESIIFNIDSQAPNTVVQEWIDSGALGKMKLIRPEYRIADSRFDFFCENEKGANLHLVEVKGCTLDLNGTAFFPDAPTLRGLKHINELIKLHKEGWNCHIIFVVQYKTAIQLIPNQKTQPAFGLALKEAQKCGVDIRALRCEIGADYLYPIDEIPIDLKQV